MPKEHIRKRGKRKTKTEEWTPAANQSASEPAPAEEEEQQQADPHAGSGIHPARLAFLQTGVRPPPEPRPKNDGEGELNEGEYGAEGDANWTRLDRTDSEFPFGVLDPDVKAYFRNVEEQIKDWEGTEVGGGGEEREGEWISD